MPAVQHRLTLPRPMARSVRRPFRPSQGTGPYRLPHPVMDRLTASLTRYRNRDAALTLAVFLARFWSAPKRLELAFPIDRRALAGHGEHGLSEARVRGAIRVLEEVGFLDRALASGSDYRTTEDGLRRKPILFVFGSEYAPSFRTAHRSAAAARGGLPGARRVIAGVGLSQPSTAFLNSPKNKVSSERSVIMGEKRIGIPPKAFEDNPNLGAALENLKRAIGVAGSSDGEGSAR